MNYLIWLGAAVDPSQGMRVTNSLDWSAVFFASPLIYSLLLLLSISSLGVWLYTFATFREKTLMPKALIVEVSLYLSQKNYSEAKALCQKDESVLGSILYMGLLTRDQGTQAMIEAMKSEGKRVSASYWQRLSFLTDVGMVAPMLGLLGTVMGMFYAFYDIHRSMETIHALFDGLGVAVGTTVAGLIVAILATALSATLKYRLTQGLFKLERESLSWSHRIAMTEHREEAAWN